SAAEKALNELLAKVNNPEITDKPAPDTLKAAESKFEMAKHAWERDMAAHVNADQAVKDLDAKAKAAADKKGAAEKAFTELTAKNTEAEKNYKAVEKTFTDAEAAHKNAIAARDVAEHSLERAEAGLKNSNAEAADFKAKLTAFEALQKQNNDRVEAA